MNEIILSYQKKVVIAFIERAFLGIKNELWSRKNDDFLSGFMVPLMKRVSKYSEPKPNKSGRG